MNKLIILTISILFFTYSHAQNNQQRVMLLADVSSSMLTQDIKPDRLQSAKQLMKAFVNSHPNVPIGLTVFAGKWKNISEPTLDHKYILSELNNLKTDTLKYSDGTSTGSALISAASCLINKPSNNSILLITDGVENGGTVSTSTATEILKYYHIRLDVIALGTNGKAPYPYTISKDSIRYIDVETYLPSKQIAEMPKTTGGFYFEVTSKQTFQNMLYKMRSPIWLKQSPAIKPSSNFRMTKERIEWLIKKVTDDK